VSCGASDQPGDSKGLRVGRATRATLLRGNTIPTPGRPNHILLIDQPVGVDIDALHDEYAHALEQVVAAKLAGRGWAEPPEPEAAVDLMAALEASIRQAAEGEEPS
jgi:hypothetical protein